MMSTENDILEDRTTALDCRLRSLGVNEAVSSIALAATDPDASLGSVAGRVTGPRCAYARTIETGYAFRPLRSNEDVDNAGAALVADVHESCLWEPVHPFLYEAAWSGAGREGRVEFGFRVLAAQDAGLSLNGQQFRFRGLAGRIEDEERLRLLHDWDCNLLASTDSTPPEAYDRFGPFGMAPLPDDLDAALETLRTTGPTRPSIGIRIVRADRGAEYFDALRAQDPTILFARIARVGEAPSECPADLILVSGAQSALVADPPSSSRPWVAAVESSVDPHSLDAEGWNRLANALDDAFGSIDGCVGWIAGVAGDTNR